MNWETTRIATTDVLYVRISLNSTVFHCYYPVTGDNWKSRLLQNISHCEVSQIPC